MSINLILMICSFPSGHAYGLFESFILSCLFFKVTFPLLRMHGEKNAIFKPKCIKGSTKWILKAIDWVIPSVRFLCFIRDVILYTRLFISIPSWSFQLFEGERRTNTFTNLEYSHE